MDLNLSNDSEDVGDNHIQRASESKVIPLVDATKADRNASSMLSPGNRDTTSVPVMESFSTTTTEFDVEENLKHGESSLGDQIALPVVSAENVEEPALSVKNAEEPLSLSDSGKEPLSLADSGKAPVSLVDSVKEQVILADCVKEPIVTLAEPFSADATVIKPVGNKSINDTGNTSKTNVHTPNTPVSTVPPAAPLQPDLTCADRGKDVADCQSKTIDVTAALNATTSDAVPKTDIARTCDVSQPGQGQPMVDAVTDLTLNVATTDQSRTVTPTIKSIDQVATMENLSPETTVTVKADELMDTPSFETMQQPKGGDSSSSCSSSDSEDEPIGPLVDDVDTIASDVVMHHKLGPLVPGELTIYDLPPIQELIIDIGKEVALTQLGKVISMLDCLVVVKANSGVRALDEGTVLFAEGRRAIGKVFETFGPVISPFYSIRFNSTTDVENSKLAVGDTIYFAASEEKSLTNYVFLEQSRSKGSDASWTQNHEPPEKFLDFSDDEAERLAKARHRNKDRKVNPCTEKSHNDGGPKKARSQHPPATSSGTPQPRRGGAHRHTRPSHQDSQQFQGPPHSGRPPPPHTGYGSHPPPSHYPSPQRFGIPPTFYSGWQAYGGAWSQKDNDYYTESPKPASQFVDTRFVQQPRDTPPK